MHENPSARESCPLAGKNSCHRVDGEFYKDQSESIL